MYKVIMCCLLLVTTFSAIGDQSLLDHYTSESPNKNTIIDGCPVGVPEIVPVHCLNGKSGVPSTSIGIYPVIDHLSVMKKMGCADSPVTCLDKLETKGCLTHPVGLYPMRPFFKSVIQTHKPSMATAGAFTYTQAPTILFNLDNSTYVPPNAYKGQLARLYLYFAAIECIGLSEAEEKVYITWNLLYPPNPAEVSREYFNELKYKTSNPLVLDYVYTGNQCNVQPTFAICKNDVTSGVTVFGFGKSYMGII